MAKMNKPTSIVACFMECNEQHRDRISRIFEGKKVLFGSQSDEKVFLSAMKDADIALFEHPRDPTKIDAPRLKWIHVNCSGLDSIAKPHILDSDVVITSASGRSAPVLAEHALYLMFAICYRTDLLLKSQYRGSWGIKDVGDRRGLHGKSLLIIGGGKTARSLAQYCTALGMKVSVFRRKPDPLAVPGVRTYSIACGDLLDGIVGKYDVVALAASLNDSSINILDRKKLGKLKRGASIVNIARGALLDEDALIAMLEEGHIAGYGSDVFCIEPLPRRHKFRSLPNVYISPHATPQMLDRTGRSIDILEDNYDRFCRNEEMLNVLRYEDVFAKTSPHAYQKQLTVRIALAYVKDMLKSGVNRRGGLWAASMM